MKKRVLIVDDDEDIRRNLEDLMVFEGYDVETAEDGVRGLALLRTAAVMPDVILLDLMMPRMDGFQFREALETDPKFSSIPIIVMTADGHVDAKKRRLGAVTLVRKPIDIDNFLVAIAALCD